MNITPKEPENIITESERLYLPEELKTNERYNIRPFEEENRDQEDQDLQALALSMERDGQIDALLITKDGTIIAGHRRRAAALIINEKRSANIQPLFRLRVRIAHGGDLRHKAIISNMLRKQLSPIQIAILIERVREERGWFNTKGAYTQVARYIGLDESSIYDYEKLLLLDKDTQRKLHKGMISKHSALLLLKVAAEDRARAVERAIEVQEEERVEKAVADYAAKKLSRARATRRITEPQSRIEHPAITQAIRETCTTIPKGLKTMGRSKKELVESITQLNDKAFPPALRELAVYWEKYARGAGNLAELKAKFVGIMSSIGQRKPARSETAAAS